MSNSCRNCRFFKSVELRSLGHCRARPPVVAFGIRSTTLHSDTKWPIVHDDDWCGEHENLDQAHRAEEEAFDETAWRNIREAF